MAEPTASHDSLTIEEYVKLEENVTVRHEYRGQPRDAEDLRGEPGAPEPGRRLVRSRLPVNRTPDPSDAPDGPQDRRVRRGAHPRRCDAAGRDRGDARRS